MYYRYNCVNIRLIKVNAKGVAILVDIMPYIWLGVMVIMAAVESITVQIVSIWFVVGAVAALISTIFTDSPFIQLAVFILVTAISLLLTRPFVKKLLNFKKEDTNAGRYIEKIGIVTEEINNDLGLGQVNVSGSVWTARSKDGSTIPKGEKIQVKEINGVKLIVSTLKK